MDPFHGFLPAASCRLQSCRRQPPKRQSRRLTSAPVHCMLSARIVPAPASAEKAVPPAMPRSRQATRAAASLKPSSQMRPMVPLCCIRRIPSEPSRRLRPSKPVPGVTTNTSVGARPCTATTVRSLPWPSWPTWLRPQHLAQSVLAPTCEVRTSDPSASWYRRPAARRCGHSQRSRPALRGRGPQVATSIPSLKVHPLSSRRCPGRASEKLGRGEAQYDEIMATGCHRNDFYINWWSAVCL